MTAKVRKPTEEKYATKIANLLEDEILKAGWPVGRRLGKEQDLVARFNVGRWVMREAIALMERDGIVTMQRGRWGGLVVSEPPERVVVHKIRNYLLFSRMSPGDLIEARQIIDHAVFGLLARKLDDGTRSELLEFLDYADRALPEEGLHVATQFNRQLYALTLNVPLAIFAESMQQALIGFGMLANFPEYRSTRMSDRLTTLFKLRTSDVRKLVEHGLEPALARLPDFADAYSKLFAGGSQLPRGKLHSFFGEQDARMSELFYRDRSSKKSSAIAHGIEEKIISSDLAFGSVIGTEAELMQEFGTGRGAMREAIRLLERDGLIVPGEGRSGGLRVGTPDPAATIHSSVLCLRSLRVKNVAVDECLACLEPAVIRSLLARPDGLPERLDEFEALAAGLLDPANDVRAQATLLYAMLANCVGNQALMLFIMILGRLASQETPVHHSGNTLRIGVYQRTMALIAALRMRDTGVAVACLHDLFGSIRTVGLQSGNGDDAAANQESLTSPGGAPSLREGLSG